MLSPEECQALVEEHGTQVEAAQALGVPRTTFTHWLHREHHRAQMRRYYRENPEPHRERSRERYWNMSGVEYNRELLRKRRVHARRRRDERTERLQGG